MQRLTARSCWIAGFPPTSRPEPWPSLDAHGAVYILEAQDSLHVSPAAEARLRAIIAEHFGRAPAGRAEGSSAILDSVRVTSDRAGIAFAKISVFEAPVPMRRIVDEIGAGIAVVENSIADEGRHSGELYQRGISKADGVAAVIAHLGIERVNTVAVGDGQNDLEMLAFAGVGIAIEGSSPELLALADLTAAPPHREGLVAAFTALGLI